MDPSAVAKTPSLLSGRYRLQEKVGEGRLAAVYPANDENLQRRVLIHVLRPDLAGQETLRQRFIAEINASAQRSHPALLEVFDSGDVNGRPFMVTDYITGKSLREHGVLTPEYALLYLRQIAGAVALCQRKNLPHPPISSTNVWLVDDGQVKLLENWLIPPDEVPLDLAFYRAPERTEGKPPDLSNTVYALGILLYELITGTRPVRGRDASEVAQAHLTMKLPPLSRVHPLLFVPTLDRLLARATAHDPDQRFPDVTSLSQALDTTWRDLTVDTQPLAVTPAPVAPQRGTTDVLQPPPWPVAVKPTPAPPSTQASPPAQAPTFSPAPRSPASAAPARPAAPPPAPPPAAYSREEGAQAPVQVRPNAWTRGITSWFILIFLITAVVIGSYTGASYLARRLFSIELPQISMPDIGLPEVNLPSIDLGIPDWVSPAEVGETLIVNNNDGLNLRDAPGLNTTPITIIPNGTSVQKLEGPEVVDNVPWVRVQVEQNGETLEGWMSLNFLIQE